MANNYSGVNTSRLLRPLYTKLVLASAGNLFINAGMLHEAQQVFMRSASSLNIKSGGEKDVLERMNRHFYTADLKVISQQTTMAELMNWFLLSTGYVQGQINVSGVQGSQWFYNFVDNAGGEDPVGGTTPATGSAMFGLKPKWIVDDKKNEIELDLHTEMWDGEYEYLMDSTITSAAALGGTGGTVLGLTGTSYSRANNLRGGVQKLKIAGNDIGVRKQGFKWELAGEDSGGGDHKLRPLCNQAKVKCEFVCRQLGADLLAAYWASGNDQTIEIDLACGYKIVLSGQPFSINEDVTIDEKDSMVKYILEGRIVYPTSFGTTPDSIDLGVGTPGTVQLNRIGF